MTQVTTLAVALLALVACARPPASVSLAPSEQPSTAATKPRASTDQVYAASTLVLEDAGQGPQLCLGGVNDSYPPQCGGPAVIGWDWDDVEGEESASGATWGEYRVVGTWDGESFTLTDKPGRARYPTGDDLSFASPCPEPAGGWKVVDDDRATEEAMQAATAYARQQPEFGGSWIDQSINPAKGEDDSATIEERMNNPRLLVLNIQFTDKLDTHETKLREIWGGSLCVSEAEHTLAELEAIADEIPDRVDDALSWGVDEIDGVIGVTVIAPNPELQQSLDEEYGEGVVKLTSVLEPVE